MGFLEEFKMQITNNIKKSPNKIGKTMASMKQGNPDRENALQCAKYICISLGHRLGIVAIGEHYA